MNNCYKESIDIIKITPFHKEIFDFIKKEGFNPIITIELNNENNKFYGYYIRIKAKFGKTPFYVEFSQNGKNVFIDIEPNSEELLEYIIEKFNKKTNTSTICTYLLNESKYDSNRNLIGTIIKNRVAELTFDEKEGYQRIKDLKHGNSYELFGTDDIFITELYDYTNYDNKLNTVRKKYKNNANMLK